ncbi:MAG: response regulator [Pseudobdellovibrionaceae bacterium]
MKHSILCVDDELDNVEALERLFRKKYSVLKATSGKQALALLDENPNLALIISDQRMPEMTGVEFLAKSLATHPHTTRILLTGYTDIESVIAAINSGQIYRYVTKPWDPNDLLTAVDRAIERFEMVQELRKKNVELAKAVEELKTLDSAKSQFMILVNHELKTPLTNILSFLELLKETSLSDDQALYVNRIQKSSQKLKEIVEDVLLIMSSQTGQMKIDLSSLTLRELKTSVTAELYRLSQNKDQTLEFSNTEIIFKSDRRCALQILNRLIHNAIKFAPEKSKIDINVREGSIGTRLSVFNPGSHIQPAMIEKILKPFTLDENVMNHSQGMGLGLSVCQSLALALGSKLEIENKNGGVSVAVEFIS